MSIGEVQIQSIATGGLGVQDADIGGESIGIEDRLSGPLIDASSTLALLPQSTMRKQALMAIPPLDEERGRLEKLDFLGSELWSGQATPLSSDPLSSSLTGRDVDSVNRSRSSPTEEIPTTISRTLLNRAMRSHNERFVELTLRDSPRSEFTPPGS